MTLSRREIIREMMAILAGRTQLLPYILYTNPKYKKSAFATAVCSALDQFVIDVLAGKRPILILTAPPQHGKSQIVSRHFPAFLMGRFPDWRIAAASYSDALAGSMAQDVRRNLASDDHLRLFPSNGKRDKFAVNRMGEFNAPGGTGSYLGVGVGAGLTGRPVDIGIIDDPIKHQQEALSATTKENHWNWFQSTFSTRMSEHSGRIVMATPWAEDDLLGRVAKELAGELDESGAPRLKVLSFPAINEPGETGYNPLLKWRGALVPELKSLKFLLEQKSGMSDYWWSALYQQSPKPVGGNVFKDYGVQYYTQLPDKFDKVVASWDCTFKDTDGTDFVVGQLWGRKGANVYLLAQVRARLSFPNTLAGVIHLRTIARDMGHPTRETLIEDKANGPAVISTLKNDVPGILAIEPDGSKLARAHAVTSYWEAHNVWIPHSDIAPEDTIGRMSGKQWVTAFVEEVTRFPAAAHDDQVDAMTQALRRLYGDRGRMIVSKAVLDAARAGGVRS